MAPAAPALEALEVQKQAEAILDAQRQAIYIRTDWMFAALMAVQWAGAVVAACFFSPRTWAGTESAVHPHLWAAIILGGLLSVFPICLVAAAPGRRVTRQVIAVSQLLMSALLIDVTNGRIETHFHVFGSLAFLAFYRDWRVLATATFVTATDHFLRGTYWPQSVYGVAAASPWLSAEHAGWVIFEDVFLLVACRQSLSEMKQISLRQAQLEVTEDTLTQSHNVLETLVAQRTQDIIHRKKSEEAILHLNRELVHAYDTTIEGWSRALDLRDHETEGHSRRVTEMTLRLAAAVGVAAADLIHIKRGALLHDIGKMGVPDAVLLKPGLLNDAEWKLMRRHPALAHEMLSPTEFLHPALDIPYCHHEKWDGSGYPQGLSAEAIPLAARIFAIVDVWDALSSDRPYRTAWEADQVQDHLYSLAGTHFDPALVPVFLQLLESGSPAAAAAREMTWAA